MRQHDDHRAVLAASREDLLISKAFLRAAMERLAVVRRRVRAAVDAGMNCSSAWNLRMAEQKGEAAFREVEAACEMLTEDADLSPLVTLGQGDFRRDFHGDAEGKIRG